MKAERVTSTLECVSIWLFTMDAANFTFGAPIGVLQSPLSAPKGKWPQSRPRSSQQIEIHETMQPANWRPLRSLSLVLTSNSDDLIQFTKSTASPTGGTWHTEMNENGKNNKIENDFTFFRHPPSGNRWPLRTCPGRPLLRTVVGGRRITIIIIIQPAICISRAAAAAAPS